MFRRCFFACSPWSAFLLYFVSVPQRVNANKSRSYQTQADHKHVFFFMSVCFPPFFRFCGQVMFRGCSLLRKCWLWCTMYFVARSVVQPNPTRLARWKLLLHHTGTKMYKRNTNMSGYLEVSIQAWISHVGCRGVSATVRWETI